MILPQACSAGLNYGVIIGQDTIRALDLDTSIQDNRISWGGEQILMVLFDYCMEDKIIQQKACFTNQPKSLTKKIEDDEVFPLKHSLQWPTRKQISSKLLAAHRRQHWPAIKFPSGPMHPRNPISWQVWKLEWPTHDDLSQGRGHAGLVKTVPSSTKEQQSVQGWSLLPMSNSSSTRTQSGGDQRVWVRLTVLWSLREKWHQLTTY